MYPSRCEQHPPPIARLVPSAMVVVMEPLPPSRHLSIVPGRQPVVHRFKTTTTNNNTPAPAPPSPASSLPSLTSSPTAGPDAYYMGPLPGMVCLPVPGPADAAGARGAAMAMAMTMTAATATGEGVAAGLDAGALGAAGGGGGQGVAAAVAATDPPLTLVVEAAGAGAAAAVAAAVSPSLAPLLPASAPTAGSGDDMGWGDDGAGALDEELKGQLLGNADLLAVLFEEDREEGGAGPGEG